MNVGTVMHERTMGENDGRLGWKKRLAFVGLAALGLMLVGAIVGLLHLALEWDEHDAKVRGEIEAGKATLRAERLRTHAREFLERKIQAGVRFNTVLIRIENGVELPASHKDVRTFTFPAISGADSHCVVTVEAYGDISAEAIWMRPQALKCEGVVRRVRGEVRATDGRILDAQVVVKDDGWFSAPSISLKLPPYTTVQAWLDEG